MFIMTLFNLLISLHSLPNTIERKKFSNNNTVGQTVKSGVNLSVSYELDQRLVSLSWLPWQPRLLFRCAIHNRDIAYEKCRVSCFSSDLLHQTLNFNRITRWFISILRFGRHWGVGYGHIILIVTVITSVNMDKSYDNQEWVDINSNISYLIDLLGAIKFP